jgi:transposase-like protein
MAPNQDKRQSKVQQKVVWQEKGASTGAARATSQCPTCGATGSTIDQSARTAYFVCPDCQSTWQRDRSQAG